MVGNVVARYPRSGSQWITGEFTGAGAAPFTAVKFKGDATFTRTGVGLATFQCTLPGSSSRPGSPCRIAAMIVTPVNLTNAAQGGWSIIPLVDSLNTNGSFTVQINTAAGAAADVAAGIIIKIALLIERELA
jgi:hypothetical protein